RGFQAARAGAEANVADYYSVRLKLHGDVAVDYFLLRRLDTEISLLQQTIGLRADSVKIIQERFESGLASEMDLELARTQLAQTQTSLLEMRRQRDDLQNALALLCGRPAAAFEIPPAPLADVAPQIPVGLPSALLERRPDVAAAERRMAAANAQIGVAKAAFFPALTLTGEAGYSSFHAATLLDWESQLFQFGPAVTVPILNGGRLRSGLKAARADYQAACATYRQQVLAAFKDVSDALVDVDSYSQQLATETNAVNAADEAARLSRERQQQGLINYLEVLEAERSQLQAQSQMIQLRALRLVSTVHLIKALGGGFDATAVTANPRPPADAASKGS
ncbi:MAG TPA: efflux transporter outer membrane subunit, partial [Verrucomicrobiae bacterium]|nr:efflux transporter outer membrane subunit [Verrucomicrobiae bacterium]